VTDAGVVTLGDVIIIGGGCYGTFYTGQLEAARQKGKADYHRLLVVDRNPQCQLNRELAPSADRELVVAEWGEFLDRYLDRPDPVSGSVIVPSPLMPHLMYQWLQRQAQRRWPGRAIETRPITVSPQTPYLVVLVDHLPVGRDLVVTAGDRRQRPCVVPPQDGVEAFERVSDRWRVAARVHEHPAEVLGDRQRHE
jgi:hypothetical protein